MQSFCTFPQELPLDPATLVREQKGTVSAEFLLMLAKRLDQAVRDRHLALLVAFWQEPIFRLRPNLGDLLLEIDVFPGNCLDLLLPESSHPEELEQCVLEGITGGEEGVDFFTAIYLRLVLKTMGQNRHWSVPTLTYLVRLTLGVLLCG